MINREWLKIEKENRINANNFFLKEINYTCGCFYVELFEKGNEKPFRTGFYICEHHQKLVAENNFNEETCKEVSKRVEVSKVWTEFNLV